MKARTAGALVGSAPPVPVPVPVPVPPEPVLVLVPVPVLVSVPAPPVPVPVPAPPEPVEFVLPQAAKTPTEPSNPATRRLVCRFASLGRLLDSDRVDDRFSDI